MLHLLTVYCAMYFRMSQHCVRYRAQAVQLQYAAKPSRCDTVSSDAFEITVTSA
jgi:hypothetical protein